MSDWFEFGLVRGILGVIIGIPLALLVFHSSAFVGQGFISQSVCHTTDVAVLILSAVLGVVICGIVFEFGAWICKRLDIKANGVWSALAVGVIGSTVVAIVSTIVIGVLLVPVNPIYASKVIGAIVVALPISIVIEAGYDVLTYAVYKYLNWPTPTL